MVSPTHAALQKIHHLDTSLSDYPDQLDEVLHGLEYEKCVEEFVRDDKMWLVEYLDKALDRLHDSHRASRKCLRELKTICRANMILPSSCKDLSEDLDVEPFSFYSGGFGDVYEGTLNGKQRVCVKRLRVSSRKYTPDITKILYAEAAIWKHLKHPNISPLLGFTTYPPQFISDWATDGDLRDYLKENPTADRIALLSDVTRALDYLHSRDVIHGDLKGFNILVNVVAGAPRASLADFDVTIVAKNPYSTRPPTKHNTCNALWSAPEVLRGENPSKESDIYAFAMVMIEVFSDHVPFGDKFGSEFVAAQAIMNGERPLKPTPTYPAYTDTLWTLTQQCWEQEPNLRPEISEVSRILALSAAPPDQGI